MTRIIAYAEVMRQRVKWARALKAAKSFRGDDLRDYAQNTATTYAQWLDRYFDGVVAPQDALTEIADALMQLQAIQDVIEERAGRR